MAAAVFGEPAAKHGVGKPHRHGDSKLPLRGFGAAGGAFGGGVERFEGLDAAAVVLFTGFGEVQVAAVALQQFGADLLLQMGNVLAGHGGGDAELVGCAVEASSADYFAKYAQSEQCVHVCLSFPVGKGCVNAASIYLRRVFIYNACFVIIVFI